MRDYYVFLWPMSFLALVVFLRILYLRWRSTPYRSRSRPGRHRSSDDTSGFAPYTDTGSSVQPHQSSNADHHSRSFDSRCSDSASGYFAPDSGGSSSCDGGSSGSSSSD